METSGAGIQTHQYDSRGGSLNSCTITVSKCTTTMPTTS